MHALGCWRGAFGALVEPLLPWRETSWQGLSHLGHLACAPHLLFPAVVASSVKTLLWLELFTAGVEGVAGYLAEGSLPNPSGCGGMIFRGVRLYQPEWPLRLVRRSPHLCQTPYRFEGRVFCNDLPSLSSRPFPAPG